MAKGSRAGISVELWENSFYTSVLTSVCLLVNEIGRMCSGFCHIWITQLSVLDALSSSKSCSRSPSPPCWPSSLTACTVASNSPLSRNWGTVLRYFESVSCKRWGWKFHWLKLTVEWQIVPTCRGGTGYFLTSFCRLSVEPSAAAFEVEYCESRVSDDRPLRNWNVTLCCQNW